MYIDISLSHSRSLNVIKTVPFESLGTVSYSYFIVTMAVCCIISEIKRDWSKIAIFAYHLYSTPPIGVPAGNIAIPFGRRKTRMARLPTVESLIIRLAVATQYRRVTDGQTNGQTDRHLSTA